ncbi:MAG: glutamate-5-semialdehyde dehydrogenase [Clostridia bacterium]|nr:glutamate-5-semialdehyde dehydrogenase [Clostridia bacterium]
MLPITEIAKQMKAAAPFVAAMEANRRSEALLGAAALLRENAEEIFRENEKDMALSDSLALPLKKRLRFDRPKLETVCRGLEELAALPDPVGTVTLRRELDRDLVLSRISVPIGVIGVVFESRPDALVQISGLCFRSGNCAILKGGSEALHTNRILFSLMRQASLSAGFPEAAYALAETREEIGELLACDAWVDLLIPRGSNAFVRYIMDHTRIPVLGHAAGVCHIYVDAAADLARAAKIVLDAKTQYPAACNAVETLLVARPVAPVFFAILTGRIKAFEAENGKKIRLLGTPEAAAILSCEQAGEDDFGHEFSDLTLAVKLVADVDEAIDHINRFGSHHTDAILTEDDVAAERFFRLVDSAGVYRNCSTRFADGYRYGFGAEVGISTSKIHARGPVGVEGLLTYKYLIEGTGQTVGEYANGSRSFHFRDLPC